jgi:hypothetical protein
MQETRSWLCNEQRARSRAAFATTGKPRERIGKCNTSSIDEIKSDGCDASVEVVLAEFR